MAPRLDIGSFLQYDKHKEAEKGVPAVFNIGFGELVIILLVALVIFGPQKLPELGRSLGQGIREFRRATQSLTEEVTRATLEKPETRQPPQNEP